jgi:NEDD8-activating enzyme E1
MSAIKTETTMEANCAGNIARADSLELDHKRRFIDIDSFCSRAHQTTSQISKTFKKSMFTESEFEASEDLSKQVSNVIKVLVVGAGGLGCELLKDLALLGFKNIDVIDMDTIDRSNLNRQFLFREEDVGKAKAICAAKKVNERVTGCEVRGHYCRIEDMGDEWYRQFHVCVMGLDSIEARRYINKVFCSFLEFDERGKVVDGTYVPIIDGGTEGFKGHARVIVPGVTPCFECSLWLYPPQTKFPLCTIAETPRSAAHCIEHAKIVQFPEQYFDKETNENKVAFDGDDPDHVTWVYERALKRAESYGIQGVTYNHTLGVVKNIVPAIPSTNAIISAYCAFEAFKVATGCLNSMDNYVMYAGADGVYQNLIKFDRDEQCSQCGCGIRVEDVPERATLLELLEKIEYEHEDTFGKHSTPINANNNAAVIDTMDGQTGITGIVCDGESVWMGGVLAPQFVENLAKFATDVLSVVKMMDDDDDEEKEEQEGDDPNNRSARSRKMSKTIYVNASKLAAPMRVHLTFA